MREKEKNLILFTNRGEERERNWIKIFYIII